MKPVEATLNDRRDERLARLPLPPMAAKGAILPVTTEKLEQGYTEAYEIKVESPFRVHGLYIGPTLDEEAGLLVDVSLGRRNYLPIPVPASFFGFGPQVDWEQIRIGGLIIGGPMQEWIDLHGPVPNLWESLPTILIGDILTLRFRGPIHGALLWGRALSP